MNDPMPLTLDAIRDAHRAIEATMRPRLAPPRVQVNPAVTVTGSNVSVRVDFVPALRIDRRTRRAWIEGIEVQRAPLDHGRIVHVVPPRMGDGFPFYEREMFLAADPLRVVRQLRRHVARHGHRGRRGAIRVPLGVA